MSGVLVALADGLAAEINAHDFTTSFDFEAERSWADKDDELSSFDSLKVEVVPIGHDAAEQLNRAGDVSYKSSCQIILRYKAKPTDREQSTGRIEPKVIDDLTALAEAFIEFLESPSHYRLTNYDSATFSAMTVETIAPRNYLRDQGMFLAVLRPQYLTIKEA